MIEVENSDSDGILRLTLLSGSRTESPRTRSAAVLTKIFGKFVSLTMWVEVTPCTSVSIAIVRATLDEANHREEHDEGNVTGSSGSIHTLRNGAGTLRIVSITETHALIEISPK